MECSRGERLSITLAKNRINRAPERAGKARVEVDIFELLRDSEYETAETSEYHPSEPSPPPCQLPGGVWHAELVILWQSNGDREEKKNLSQFLCSLQRAVFIRGEMKCAGVSPGVH